MCHLDELLQEFNELLKIIKKFNEYIEKELCNEESPFVYNSSYIIDGVDLKGKSYLDIEFFLKYIINNSEYQSGMKFRELLRTIKLTFCDNMILDVAISKYPKSFDLYQIYNQLMDKVEFINENGFKLFENYFLILTLEDLDKFEGHVKLIYLNLCKQVRSSIKNNDSSWLRRKKASSEYIKRNKK